MNLNRRSFNKLIGSFSVIPFLGFPKFGINKDQGIESNLNILYSFNFTKGRFYKELTFNFDFKDTVVNLVLHKYYNHEYTEGIHFIAYKKILLFGFEDVDWTDFESVSDFKKNNKTIKIKTSTDSLEIDNLYVDSISLSNKIEYDEVIAESSCDFSFNYITDFEDGSRIYYINFPTINNIMIRNKKCEYNYSAFNRYEILTKEKVKNIDTDLEFKLCSIIEW